MAKEKNSAEEISNEASVGTVKSSESAPEESAKKKSKSVKITAEEISLTADRDVNFMRFQLKKGVPTNFTRAAFEELCKQIPNLEKLRASGAIKIVL